MNIHFDDLCNYLKKFNYDIVRKSYSYRGDIKFVVYKMCGSEWLFVGSYKSLRDIFHDISSPTSTTFEKEISRNIKIDTILNGSNFHSYSKVENEID